MLDFSIYSSGSTGCEKELLGFTIGIDWSATLGRWASRYPTTLVSWAVGVAAIVILGAWHTGDMGGGKFFIAVHPVAKSYNQNPAIPTVQEALSFYGRKTLRKLLLISIILSVIPLPAEYYLGNGGDMIFIPIAPLLLLVASGLVCISWWILVILMWPIGRLGRSVFGRCAHSYGDVLKLLTWRSGGGRISAFTEALLCRCA
jgi:glycosylphosphatidylinositol deacylase